MNNLAVKKLYLEKHVPLPSINSLLKISLALILFTVISTALVYAETMSVDVNGTTFDFEYTADKVIINNIIAQYEPNIPEALLIISVDATENSGTLDLVFDRTFFDSTFNNDDDSFFILADGLEVNFSETETTQNSRSLNIEIPAGTQDLEIIGTFFGDSTTVVVSNSDDEETKRLADEAETKRLADEAETKRLADEAETKRLADEAESKRLADEAESKRLADKTTPTQCGPGTILKNGACVLDERCGPGTILMDGVCVVDPTQSSGSTSKGMGTDFATGMIYAIVIAGAILLILALIAMFGKQFRNWTN